ncbi:MAG: hypothetical protein M1818_004816 [Claussenomyces sp. TS43310]|nr:MAG: hypothetical protein M1818_004816 [Claussenomyces sp. TS43310]
MSFRGFGRGRSVRDASGSAARREELKIDMLKRPVPAAAVLTEKQNFAASMIFKEHERFKNEGGVDYEEEYCRQKEVGPGVEHSRSGFRRTSTVLLLAKDSTTRLRLCHETSTSISRGGRCTTGCSSVSARIPATRTSSKQSVIFETGL